MLICRHAGAAFNRSLGAVTQALEHLAAAEGQVLQAMPANGPGASRGRTAQLSRPHQTMPSMSVRVITGKASGTTADESGSDKEKVSEVHISGTANGTTTGSDTSRSRAKDEPNAEMGEEEFQKVLLAAAMKHVVGTVPLLSCTAPVPQESSFSYIVC